MGLLILFGVGAIAVSFLCSLLEACLLSLSSSYVTSLVERGAWAGPMLSRMKKNIDRPLAAILTMNTIAHTVGAAGVGAQAARVFGSASVGIASAIMTFLILVFSEIIPKTLGAVHAKSLATPVAVTIRIMIFVCYPILAPLEWLNRLIGYQRTEDRLSRAEIVAALRLGHDSGAVDKQEYLIATNLIALSEIPLASILTPRTVVFSLPEDMTIAEVLGEHHPFKFSRIPVYSDHPERLTGYVPRFEIEAARSEGDKRRRLADLAQPIPAFSEKTSVGSAMDAFIRKRYHIACVQDGHGGMAGIVTLEDLLETLLGREIVDETDTAEDMRRVALEEFRRRHPGRGDIPRAEGNASGAPPPKEQGDTQP